MGMGKGRRKGRRQIKRRFEGEGGRGRKRGEVYNGVKEK